MDEMKKCTQCGTELPGDALFCPDCGARQTAAAAPDSAPVANATGSMASYDPFIAQAAPSVPATSTPVQPSPPPPFQPSPAFISQPPPFQPSQPPPYPPSPSSNFQPVPAGKAQPVPPSTQTPPPAAGFQYATPNIQQGAPSPYAPQPGMPGGAKPPYPPQSGSPNGNPAGALKPGRKFPIFLLVVGVVLAAGLFFWLFRFFSSSLAGYSFDDTASKGVVFALILMTILAILSTVVLRVQLRGKKLAILANVLLVMIVIAILFGISITEFIDGDLPYNLFINIVP